MDGAKLGAAAPLGAGATGEPGRPSAPSEQAPGPGPPRWDRRNREVRNGASAPRPHRLGALTKHGGRSVVPALHAKAAALSKDGGADRPYPGGLRGAGDPLGTEAETPHPTPPGRTAGLIRGYAGPGPGSAERGCPARSCPPAAVAMAIDPAANRALLPVTSAPTRGSKMAASAAMVSAVGPGAAPRLALCPQARPGGGPGAGLGTGSPVEPAPRWEGCGPALWLEESPQSRPGPCSYPASPGGVTCGGQGSGRRSVPQRPSGAQRVPVPSAPLPRAPWAAKLAPFLRFTALSELEARSGVDCREHRRFLSPSLPSCQPGPSAGAKHGVCCSVCDFHKCLVVVIGSEFEQLFHFPAFQHPCYYY